MRPAPFIREVTSDEDFSRLESSWNDLLARSEADTIFLRWEWLFTWWHLFGKTLGKLCILVVEESGKVIGIAPFYLKNERFPSPLLTRTLRYLGTGENEENEIDSEYLSVLSPAGREEEITEQVLDYILSHSLCDAIRLSKMVLDSKTALSISSACAKRGIPCHVLQKSSASFIRLPKTWEEYLASLTSAMRYEIRSDRRKLLKYGEVQFRGTNAPEEINTDFDEMARLHRIHWLTKGQPGVFENQCFSLFHKTMLPLLLKNGALQLCFLSLSGKNIGVGYHFLYNNKFIFYQTGFDRETAPNVSVGLVTISYCIEQAIRMQCTEYDFLGGGQVYKTRLAHQARWVGEFYIPVRFMAQSLWSIRRFLTDLKKGTGDVIPKSHSTD